MGKIRYGKRFMPRTPASFMAQREPLTVLRRRQQIYQNTKQVLESHGITVDERFLESLPPTKRLLELELKRISNKHYTEYGQEDVVRTNIGSHYLEFYELLRITNINGLKKARRIMKKAPGKRTQSDNKFLMKEIKITQRIKAQAKKAIALTLDELGYRNEQLRTHNIRSIQRFVDGTNFITLLNDQKKVADFAVSIRHSIIFPQRRFDLTRKKYFEQLLNTVKHREITEDDLVKLYTGFKSSGQIEREMEDFSKAIDLGQNYLSDAGSRRKKMSKAREVASRKKMQEELERLKRNTKGFIDWEKVDAEDPGAMKRAALRLWARRIKVPDFLKPYLPPGQNN